MLLAYLAGFFFSLVAGAAGGAISAFLLVASAFVVAPRRREVAAAMVVTALCGALAAGRVPFVEPALVSPYLDREIVLEGKVFDLRKTDTGWAGTLEDAKISFVGEQKALWLGKVLLYVRNPDQPVAFPAVIRAMGRLRPAGGAGPPGHIPMEWTAMVQGARYSFFTDTSRAVFLSTGREAGRVEALFSDARRRTGEWVRRHCGTGDGTLYLLSLATGETPPASHPVASLLRKTGLAHLFAISGVNVAVFHLAALFLVRSVIWMIRRRHGTPDLNLLSAIISLPVCWAYVLMAGSPVPAVRSAGMITLSVLAWRRFRVRAVGLAWSVMLILTLLNSPMEIFSPSFLLSYGATFFLVANCVLPSAEDSEGYKGKLKKWLKEAIRAASVAFLGTLPISAAFFQTVPLGSILWNVLFGPILGTAGVAGAVLAVLGGVFGIDALGPVVRFVTEGLNLALSALDVVSMSGAGCLSVPPSGVAAPFAALMVAAAGTIWLIAKKKAPWPAPLIASALFLGWIYLPYIALPRADLRFTALNVGKGSSFHVEFPGGGNALIDTGSALQGNFGERAVVPFLRSRGIRHVDILALSHAHEDHYGGAAAVLSSVSVGEIWLPDGVPKEAFGSAVSSWGGVVRWVRAGHAARFGNAELIVRGTEKKTTGRNSNEQVALLELRFVKTSVWIPGDVEKGPSEWGDTAFP
ncbi:MAG: ComEC/Rec2 family competence protein, partial [Syntrophorhabdaceae bacterium]|nr:ComEC/Rec2 family competence protein [Syntrophorhabdaceae bacterium]